MDVGVAPDGGTKMKETPEDVAVADHAFDAAASELRQFIERWEQLDAEPSVVLEWCEEAA